MPTLLIRAVVGRFRTYQSRQDPEAGPRRRFAHKHLTALELDSIMLAARFVRRPAQLPPPDTHMMNIRPPYFYARRPIPYV